MKMKKTYETMMISVIALSNEDILTLSLLSGAEDEGRTDKKTMSITGLY